MGFTALDLGEEGLSKLASLTQKESLDMMNEHTAEVKKEVTKTKMPNPLSRGGFTFLCRPSRDGHKFFRKDFGGYLVVADNSGEYPHETDDGPLYIDKTRPITDAPGSKVEEPTFSIPVSKKPGPSKIYTFGTRFDLIYLMEHHLMVYMGDLNVGKIRERTKIRD